MKDLKLYLVRHGETEWNKEEIFRGRKDIPLNETGKVQAERVGEYLAKFGIDLIYTSPLLRARETASFISKETGAPVTVLEELNDMDFGIWEGLSLGDVMRRYPKEFETWKLNPHVFKVEGCESLREVRKRVSKGLKRILRDRKEKGSIAIVSHRVICKILAMLILGVPNRYFWRIKIDPASISTFEYRDGHFVTTLLNQTSHLESLSHGYRDF